MTSHHPFIVEPATLEGSAVRLEPLSMDHLQPLCAAGLFPDLWRFTAAQVHSAEDMRSYVEEALALQQAGKALPFVTLDRKSGAIIGSTRFWNIEAPHRSAEIGWTWITPAHQRSAINTEAKYLMLRHAFEVMGCIRVSLKTDLLNERSQRAIERIGGKREGVLRNHMIVATGRRRHSVMYSVIVEEWPETKEHLERLLAGYGPLILSEGLHS